MKNILMVLVCLSLSVDVCVVFAASEAPRVANLITTQSAATVANEQSKQENALLREQLKVMKDYHGSLLDTVYWALAGVFTLAVVLSSFGWWSNFRLYEGDKRRLHEDLNTKILDLEAKLAVKTIELESQFALMSSELDAQLTKRNAALQSEIERDMDAKSEAHLSRLISETGGVRLELTGLIKEIDNLENGLQETKSAIPQAISKIEKTLARTNAELRQVEEHIWQIKQVPTNILITQGQGLKAAAAAENTDLVNGILSRMKQAIKKEFIDKDKTIDQNALKLINARVTELSDTDGVDIAEVFELLSKIKVEPTSQENTL